MASKWYGAGLLKVVDRTIDFADITWTAINAGTIGGVVLVKEITNDAASPIIAFLDPTNLVTNGGDVTLVVNAEGALQISYA